MSALLSIMLVVDKEVEHMTLERCLESITRQDCSNEFEVIIADNTWLADPDRVYPVTVDPVIEIVNNENNRSLSSVELIIENGIIVDGIEFKSKKMLCHLRNSSSIILFGATLGQGADTLIRKYSVTDIAMTAVAQAVAGSMVENLCDIACEELKTAIKGEHRPRFSPGYGDFHISAQSDFFKLLPMNKQLGISLSDGFMMTPTKTVTAFIGVIKE